MTTIYDRGVYTYNALTRVFRVKADQFETKDESVLKEHVANLLLAQNLSPTPIGPSIEDTSWLGKRAGTSVACPSEFAHILDYFPTVVFQIMVAAQTLWSGAFQPPQVGLRIIDGECWEIHGVLNTIQSAEVAYPNPILHPVPVLRGALMGIIVDAINMSTNGRAFAALGVS